MRAVFWAALRPYRTAAEWSAVRCKNWRQRRVVAKGTDGVHHQCRQLEHGPVEFHDGLRDANRGESGGVDFTKPRLWRVGVVISEAYHSGEIKVRFTSTGREVGVLGRLAGSTSGCGISCRGIKWFGHPLFGRSFRLPVKVEKYSLGVTTLQDT